MCCSNVSRRYALPWPPATRASLYDGMEDVRTMDRSRHRYTFKRGNYVSI